MQFAKQKWQRDVFIGSSEVFPCLQEAMRSGSEAIQGDWLTCVIVTKRFSFRELCGRGHLDHLECLSGLMKIGVAFYITSYCMPQLLLSLSFLFALTSMAFRFIISLLMPLQPSGREIKRTGGIQSSCAWSSSLAWFLFVSPPLYFF